MTNFLFHRLKHSRNGVILLMLMLVWTVFQLAILLNWQDSSPASFFLRSKRKTDSLVVPHKNWFGISNPNFFLSSKIKAKRIRSLVARKNVLFCSILFDFNLISAILSDIEEEGGVIVKVIEMLKKCDVKKVCECWDEHYKDTYEFDKYESGFIPGYVKTLIDIAPVDSEFKIMIQNEKLIDGEESIVVSGVKEGEEKKYGLDFSPNAEWVGFEVVVSDDLKGLDIDELVCHILWEMSFYGDDESKQEHLEEIKRRTKEIEKWREEGTLDQHTLTMEEVDERIKEKLGEMK